MQTSQKSITPSVKKLGILAGGGQLPFMLVRACQEQDIEAFIVGFEGQTDPTLTTDQNHIWSRIGAPGTIIKALKNHDIEDIVLIGSIRRPSLSEMRPDLKATEFFSKIAFKALGDNDMLILVRQMLEEEGFTLHGAHEFIDDLLTPEGLIGKHKPAKGHAEDIQCGLEASQALGALDIGQSVIVQEGIVIGLEAAEGTSELIKRCRHLYRKGRKAVLIKTCKPGQDRDLDLPTIGPETLELCVQNDIGGIALHAQNSLLIDREKVAALANTHKIFVIGLNPEAPNL